jgi:hypothetical protein
MSLVLADRVRETTQTTGTGTLTLDGAVQGFQSFSVIGNNNTTYYTINRGSEWEVGIGTYYGGTLSRDTVYASSNGGTKVNFSAGAKDVFVTYPAEKSVNQDANNRVLIPYTSGTTNVGSLNVGDATAHTDSGVIAGFTASEPLYLYTSLQNTSASNTSYASYAINDGGHTAYGELGINNANYSYSAAGFPNNGFSTPLASFVESYGGPLVLGSWDSQKISFIVNGAVNTADAMTIETTGAVTIPTAAITGGAINGATVGATTPAAGTFTTLIGGGDVANYGQLTGGATTKAVEFKSLGSDTNVAYAIRSKGTGAIDLAAGTSGINISNGGTVTALTRTVAGSTYTSIPSVAITAPTTAGGVQATATVAVFVNAGTVASGGTGYTNGDVLTIVGGTFVSAAATLTVTAVTSGVITAVSVSLGATYTTTPSNPVSVTGGTGSGATFNLTYGILNTFTITNAGSGYVEQPTVTFSGGGGSGAAAYAGVGSSTIIRSLAGGSSTSLDFYTPASITSNIPVLRLRDSSGGDSYAQMSSHAGYAQMVAQGNTNAILKVGSAGTGSLYLNTNGTSETNQMRVSHTASAVNYVQVTGGATGGSPTISAQGSDANVGLSITSKGTLPLYLNTAGITDVRIQPNGIRTFSFSSVTSAVNYGLFTSAAAGFSPALSVAGSDTDIDLTLTPKGAGAVRFGTYTASVLTPTGYITIKDSGGTTRRLLVG